MAFANGAMLSVAPNATRNTKTQPNDFTTDARLTVASAPATRWGRRQARHALLQRIISLDEIIEGILARVIVATERQRIRLALIGRLQIEGYPLQRPLDMIRCTGDGDAVHA